MSPMHNACMFQCRLACKRRSQLKEAGQRCPLQHLRGSSSPPLVHRSRSCALCGGSRSVSSPSCNRSSKLSSCPPPSSYRLASLSCASQWWTRCPPLQQSLFQDWPLSLLCIQCILQSARLPLVV